MSKPKLTARQIETLAELAKPKNRAHYMPYMGRFNQTAYWFVASTMEKATKQVRSLIALGYLDATYDKYHSRGEARISKAGRAALRAARRQSV